MTENNDTIENSENGDLSKPEETGLPAAEDCFELQEKEESAEYAEEVPGENQRKKARRKRKRKKPGFWKGMAAGLVIMFAAITICLKLLPYDLVLVRGDSIIASADEEKLEYLSNLIQNYYYEDVDQDDLINGLYKGLFDNLDIYSQYYTPEEYEDLYKTDISGTYCGIGASLQQDEETKTVSIVHVYEESPAEKAGLQAGDIIIQADEYKANDTELSILVGHIRGEEGTSVHLKVYRAGEYLEYDITRENLNYPTVSYEMMEDQIGYIAVSEFTESTPEQFRNALEDLQSQDMAALIVDLRSNPGGMLTSVCEMLDEILPEGLLVYTEDRQGNREDYTSTDDESLDVPLAVLVNGSSASASEIFSGAVQDRDAGILIGTKTYGKGVVQSVGTLKDGSAFKLTTSRYYTPNGTCIQGIGITPDIELSYEFLGGEDDTYSYEFDNQIQKALEVLEEELK